MRVLPKMVGFTTYGSVRDTAETELTALEDPFKLSTHQESFQSGCFTTLANGIKTLVNCTYAASLNIPLNKDNKTESVKTAQRTQELLQQNGWEGRFTTSSDRPNLESLFAAIADGVDYMPDASYTKNISGVKCMLQAYTAFSQPSSPMLSLRMMCSKDVAVIGEPNWN